MREKQLQSTGPNNKRSVQSAAPPHSTGILPCTADLTNSLAWTADAAAAGDVWAAVGWSHDLIPLAERSSNIVLVAPAAGTILWSDVWVVPHQAQGGSYKEGPSPLLPSWLEFCVMPGRVVTLSGLKTGASPQLLDGWGLEEQQLEDGDETLKGAENFLPPPTVLERSEFIEEVGEETKQLYSAVLRA